VLGLICEGLDDKAIAQRLSLSGNTVRNHVANIYGKIGVNRRAAAIAWARERGLV
jgi:DNA-binding CsgD family transcriptional regulator